MGSNPRPSDREPSALPLDHSFRLLLPVYTADFLFFQNTYLSLANQYKSFKKEKGVYKFQLSFTNTFLQHTSMDFEIRKLIIALQCTSGKTPSSV
jgi:hypothetical protein